MYHYAAPALEDVRIVAELASFLRVALLLGGPPVTFLPRLSRDHQLLVTEGNRI